MLCHQCFWAFTHNLHTQRMPLIITTLEFLNKSMYDLEKNTSDRRMPPDASFTTLKIRHCNLIITFNTENDNNYHYKLQLLL